MSCNCNNNPCGCTDTTLTSPVTTVCNNTEPCEELVYTECVSYNGNNIVDIPINNNDRMDIVIKKIVSYLTNPTCFDITAECQAIYDFEVQGITSTAATVFWTVPGAPAEITSVKIEYSTSPTFGTSTIVTVTAATQWSLINLIPNTEYYIRMITGTDAEVDCCTSITLNFKTLAS